MTAISTEMGENSTKKKKKNQKKKKIEWDSITQQGGLGFGAQDRFKDPD